MCTEVLLEYTELRTSRGTSKLLVFVHLYQQLPVNSLHAKDTNDSQENSHRSLCHRGASVAASLEGTTKTKGVIFDILNFPSFLIALASLAQASMDGTCRLTNGNKF